MTHARYTTAKHAMHTALRLFAPRPLLYGEAYKWKRMIEDGNKMSLPLNYIIIMLCYMLY